ncbi:MULTISPECIES: insulinase family protein [unclassified Vibrio]|uniref:Protease 3 n=1 Tax=Vibrio sp. HB236076 TaxID=3232307 RepID=A0AB39HI63_9VIBR|nr:insulinase family protein [Vibrio sp. HB161653]MDP5254758.1 insulinase family protein [Vibrio sp. HB161653]
MHQSPNDNNQYHYITLSNQLRVLLIHQPQASKSAAALAVNVGHFDDPQSREGLAHYLEHMLFLGTERYPRVGDFQNFVSQHGGANNAWTGTEHTCYFFDIDHNAFERGLDRFSQFFTAPLFNQEALDKERHAVDSEFKLKLKDDNRRIYQVNKELVNPAHPFAKFSVGNLTTLDDRNGQSIRSEIVQFHQQHYSADLMTLTLMSPEPLSVLEQWATHYFADIENHHLFPKTVSIDYQAKLTTGHLVEIQPVKDLRKLQLTFPLPSSEADYRIKPLSYIAHLIGYEGENSLMMTLKDQGWITSLIAGGGASGSNYRDFTISCHLTELGFEHVDDIVQHIFHYIGLIVSQGLDAWRYQEKKTVMAAAFQFQEPTRPIDLVSHLAINMQHYDDEDVIFGDYRMSDYDQAMIEQRLSLLSVDNVRLTLIHPQAKVDRHAKWYQTPYSVTPFRPQQKDQFRTPLADSTLALPLPNPFISDQLEPQALSGHAHYPELIEEKAGFRLWHLQDREFRLPKGIIYIAIDSPHAVASVTNIVKTRLCVEMFLDALAKQTYQAEIAGMHYNLYAHQGGVTLTLSGFSQQQPKLLKVILEKFATRSFSQERFENIKQQLKRSWSNAQQDRPLSQLFSGIAGLLQPNNPPYCKLLQAIDDVDVESLPDFVSRLLSELHIEMFVHGDWQQSQALQMAEVLKNALRIKDQSYQESLRPLVMLGRNGTYQWEIECQQSDSAVVVYHQCPDTEPRSIALYALANHLMSAEFFHQIRTKQQLGYMVGTGNMPMHRHPGLVLYVQSPSASPQTLISSIDEFLNAFYLLLLELTDYQWHSSKKGLWNQISAPDTTLKMRSQRLWVAIGNKDNEFNQRERVLEQLKSLTRADMMRFVVNELKPRTANRLVMHSHGLAHVPYEPLNIGKKIDDVAEFQKRRLDRNHG